MTPQEVIKTFMDKLANHGYTSSSSVSTKMLNDAVKASSGFLSIQNVIDSMKADQISAEREAVEEVLGSAYAGKLLSEVPSSIRSAQAKTYDTNNIGNAYYNSNSDNRTTVERLIKERKAIIFLEKYCGIQLENNYWINSNNNAICYGNDTTGNVDTGAITGSDANISLKAGDEVYGTTLTSDLMANYAQKDGVSLSGDTLIIGTGIEKTRNSVVPEIGNMYTASTAQAQSISTGSHDWIVVATSENDTISTGGADSIVAGSGNDKIVVGADYASIQTGAGSDTVEISSEVANVTIGDLDSSDTLTISGTFEIKSARIEDTLLVIRDKTGTRQIRLGNLDSAKNAKVNSTTLATWLSNAGINVNSLSSTSSSNVIEEPAKVEIAVAEDGGGRIDIDEEYQPAQTKFANVVAETQNIATKNSNGTFSVNLDDVTITEGTITGGGNTVGTISNEFPNVSSFTKNGLTINLLGVTSDKSGGTNGIQSKTFDQLTDDQKTIVAGLFKWWAEESLNLNEESYGIGFNSPTAKVKEIGLFFYDSQGTGSTLATVWSWSSAGDTTKLMLNVNMNYYKGIAADNVDGESSGTTALLDRTLSHEFTHAVMSTNIKYFTSLPQFIKEGMAELTHGIDDERGNRIFEVAYDASRLNNALNLTNTGTGTADAYAGGYMFLRYFARQAALQDLVGSDNPDTIGTWSLNGTTATYTVYGSVVATIKGLASGLAVKGNTIDGITVSDGVITLSKKVLGTTNITLTSNDYVLALGNDVENKVTVSNKVWTVSKGTATLKGNLTAGYSLLETGKTITYSAAKNNQALATVKGLATTGVSASDFSTTDNVITLKKSMLATSKVTVTGDGYTLALADDAPKPTAQGEYWAFNKTNAYYRQNISAGFTLAEDGKSATYSALTAKNLATVSGIKNVTAANKTAIANAISINDKVITLGKDALATSKVTVTGEGYTLNLADDAPKPALQPEYWAFNKTNAYYRQDTSAGFTLAADEKSATYSALKTATLATVSGIKNVTAANKASIADAITISDKVITLGKDALATSKVTVTGDGYTLNLADDAPKPDLQPEYWAFNKTNAYYRQDTSAGFTLAADEKSATYSALKTATLATVSGIKNVTAANKASIANAISINDKVITLGKDALATSKVTVAGEDYTLNMDSSLTSDTPVDKWTVSGTNATYDKIRYAYFSTTDNKTFTYNAAKKLANLATVKGLVKGATVNAIGDVSDKNGNTILSVADTALTLTNNSSFGSTVTVSLANDYTLNNQLTAPAVTKTYWTVENGTATLKQEKSDGYTSAIDKKTGATVLTYNAAKTGKTTLTLATITGLKNNASLDSFSLSGNVITLTADALPDNPTAKTVIKLGKNDAYTLKLADEVPDVEYNDAAWSYSKGTATLKATVKTAGYSSSDDAKTIAYIPTVNGKNIVTKTYATVSGVKSANGITVEDNVIKLTSAALNNKNVTLGKNDPYTLALDDDSLTPAPGPETWNKISNKNGNKAALTVTYSPGYTPSADSKTLKYSATTVKTLAAINGINKDADISTFNTGTDYDNKEISLTTDQLTKSAAVSGEYKFDFDSTYNYSTISGSAANDTINVAGTGLTITGGNGDDYIDLGNGSNTLVYANGNGNDVIANFTAANDKIKITKGTPSVSSNGSDVIVKVGAGSIKLNGAAGQTITILDANNKAKTYTTTAPTDSADLLIDDNYADSAQLSEIVQPASVSYTPYDFDTTFSLTKEEKLTPALTYSADK